MTTLILVFITSFLVVLYSTPSLIKVAILKRLFDAPSEERKIHKRAVPSIGGIIIFAGTIFSFALWYKVDNGNVFQSVNEFKLIVATSLVLFFVGVKDDIIGTAPIIKLVAHIVVALILALMGDIRITSLHGIFGVDEIPQWGSVFISIFTYVVVVNAFNLIDGVDGLAAGVGFIACCAFGTWFIFAGNYPYASLAFALAGALGGFLIFNFSPARIFMGDSGSLVIGVFVCVLAIKMIEYPIDQLDKFWVHVSKPVFAIAALAYPLLDTLRVFLIRAFKGQSPFAADRNHIHHKLLDCKFSHAKAVGIIYAFSVVAILTAASTYYLLYPTLGLLAVIAVCALFLFIVFNLNKRKAKQRNSHAG